MDMRAIAKDVGLPPYRCGPLVEELRSMLPRLGTTQTHKDRMEEESRKRKERLAQMRRGRNSGDTVEESVSGVVEETVARHRREAEQQQQEVDIAAIAPKRADWDLKRDLQRRLDALQPQNEAAVRELIRRRLQEGDTRTEA
ncbi:hypothetical protein GGI15_001455 [Coemansia interrupta]|uniref:Uncharacterized protein n=1 Tax=Coemansia interrupta TaxID=1126814 RepID=A0A9W8HHY4_9FUNG|nr:hypothetical protein GGI15_001455 [Coemansia interrupta]